MKLPQPIDEAELRKLVSDVMADLMVSVSLQKMDTSDGMLEAGRKFIKQHNGKLDSIMTLFQTYTTQAVTAALKQADAALPGKLGYKTRNQRFEVGHDVAIDAAHQAITNELKKWEEVE